MSPETPLVETYKGVLPFVVTDIVRVVILAAFPVITLMTVRLLY
jgi:C4-dicarboxylate transporter, DctM subunit